MSSEPNPCPGCGDIITDNYTHVGITKDEDGKFAAFPICDPCFYDTSHRKFRLKMHYFPRESKNLALSRAGSTDIG